MSTAKMRAPTTKEWNLKSWNGDISEDPDEAGDVEPLNCDEFSVSVEVATPPPSEEITLHCLRKL